VVRTDIPPHTTVVAPSPTIAVNSRTANGR